MSNGLENYVCSLSASDLYALEKADEKRRRKLKRYIDTPATKLRIQQVNEEYKNSLSINEYWSNIPLRIEMLKKQITKSKNNIEFANKLQKIVNELENPSNEVNTLE